MAVKGKASSREPGTGAGAAHEDGMECWVWNFRQNEDYAWQHNRSRWSSHAFLWLSQRWVSGHGEGGGTRRLLQEGGSDMMLTMTEGSE